MATKATGAKKSSSKTASSPAEAVQRQDAEQLTATEPKAQVCLVLALAGGTDSVTVPQLGTLYDELKPDAEYKKCVRVSGLDDMRLGKNADGHWRLRDWVSDVVRVVMYTEGGAILDIGGVDVIGLTSATIDTETKGIPALQAEPVALFTPAALKEIGL